MPLVVAESQFDQSPEKVLNILTQTPWKEHAYQFRDKQVQTVGAERLLYVNQREYAVLHPDDQQISVVGTEDATTCHIVVLRHSESGVIGLAHCDGCGMEEGIINMVSKVNTLSAESPDGRLELYLFGGFKDERQESMKLSNELIDIFLNLEQCVHLRSACITDLNTTYKENVPFPVIYGIGVDIKSGSVFPARFPIKGPDMPIRSACHFAGYHKMMDIYDNETQQLVVGPFSWKPWREAANYADLPDPFIRQYLSTSPKQEPEGFEDSVRRSLFVLRDHPTPQATLFQNNKARIHKILPNGTWQLL